MSRSEEMFAQLLTEGIHTIKIREFKSIGVIQDELGYALGKEKGGVSIEYWRKGHIPSELSDVERLAREIVKRGNLDQEWLKQFLFYAGYPQPADLINELFPATPAGPRPQVAPQLPDKSYREPIGRETLMNEIITALRDPDGRRIVAIDGLGGIGKTTLALEVTEQCLKQHLFEAMVWVSAAANGTPHQGYAGEGRLTFDRVLDTIGVQLGDRDVPTLEVGEKERRVQTLLHDQPVLVVLDNLETAREEQDKIAGQLRPFLAPSKALLTSRHRFKGDLYAVHLAGLGEDRAVRFICQEAIEKGIKGVETAKSEELRRIARATGGSPAAMKLVVEQLTYLPLEVVLSRLREAQVSENKMSQEDEYLRFYKSIFFPSWKSLSDNGKRLLSAMTQFGPGTGERFEAIKAASGFADNRLISAIDELWRFSFLEVGEPSSLSQVSYYLHALTQYFVLANCARN